MSHLCNINKNLLKCREFEFSAGKGPCLLFTNSHESVLPKKSLPIYDTHISSNSFSCFKKVSSIKQISHHITLMALRILCLGFMHVFNLNSSNLSWVVEVHKRFFIIFTRYILYILKFPCHIVSDVYVVLCILRMVLLLCCWNNNKMQHLDKGTVLVPMVFSVRKNRCRNKKTAINIFNGIVWFYY